MSSPEKIPLTEETASRTYYGHEIYQFYTRQRRKQLKLRCLVSIVALVIFTMALVVTISYTVSHDSTDDSRNLTSLQTEMRVNLSSPLRLGFVPGSGSYTFFSNTANIPSANSIFVTNKKANFPMTSLTDEEFKQGVLAGQQAIDNRLSADAIALESPIPLESPELRHRYAVSTCPAAGTLALAAVGEIAATKKIENSRSILDEPSSIGSFFNGGWLPEGICKELLVLNCTVGKYRTIDGTCNRPMQWGSSLIPYRRVLTPNYSNGIDAPRKAMSGKELPSAREVSVKVHKPSPSSNPAFTVMLAVYGQFLDHDITATALSQGINGSSISCCPPAIGHPECFTVPIGPGDPVFETAGRTCMEFVRSAPAPQCRLGPREQLNQVTAFIDGSAIYGSDVQTARNLREFVGGRLRMQITPDNRTLLPASMDPNDGCNREAERLKGRYCFAAGDARANENLHLTTMHLLWARQHNKVADQLAKINPNWNDETLYQEARRIIGAQLQHITYQEFLPIVLGEEEVKLRDLKPLISGYRQWTESPNDATNNPTIANNFATAAFRFAHTLLPGLMKVTDAQKGTSTYVELHRMLFNPYSLYAEGGIKSSITSAADNVIQMTSTHVTSQLTNHLFEDPIRNVTIPCGLDLVSLNIQRGRDHGLPGYTQWREYCGLGKPEAFSDLEGHLDPQALEEISSLYESVHDIDLYTGALAELPKPDGIVGPTFSCLIAEQFVRLQKGDRFWYEVPDGPHSFTEGQLQEIRKITLAKLICDCSDSVTQIQANVMRSTGPENPMMMCEDIPQPSLELWKETKPTATPILKASLTPFNWMDLKTNILDTVHDLVTFINTTTATTTPITTDWIAFRSRINDSFTDLRNQLAELNPPKVTQTATFTGKPMYGGGYTLKMAPPPGIFQDWINFKFDLLKSLNNSIGMIGGGPAAAIKWIAFKQNITNQFLDLKNQVSSLKMEVTPKLLMLKYQKEQAAISNAGEKMKTLPSKEAAFMIPAIFDWKNFKDNIISSLDDAIVSVGNNMPAPGDPAWMTFGTDIRDRFIALKDKINAQVTTMPTELAGSALPGLATEDWLSVKSDIVKTVNDAVQKIEDDMPPPGDPAWLAYRDDIMKKFAAFKGKPFAKGGMMPFEFAAPYSFGVNSSAKGQKLPMYPVQKLSVAELTNLTTDWLDFRTKINATLTDIIKDIQSKKPAPFDPLGWIAFKQTTMNDFAGLKNQIMDIKGQWLAELYDAKSKINPALSPMLKGVFGDPMFGGYPSFPKFDYTSFLKPVIPPEDWMAFKTEINDTLMNFLTTVNTIEKIDLDELHDTFNQTFAELKSEIASLRDLITAKTDSLDFKFIPTPSPTAAPNSPAADWINFRAQLNSTINEFVERLKNESKTTIGDMMKIMFEARDKLSGIQSPMAVPPAEWIPYAIGINKTVADTLKSISDLKHVALMIKASEPVPSSSHKPEFPANWSIVLHTVLAISSYLCRY